MKFIDIYPEHKPGDYHVTVAADGLQTWRRLRKPGERVNNKYAVIKHAWFNAQLRRDVDELKSRLAANVVLLDIEAIKWLVQNHPRYAGRNVATLDRRLREPPSRLQAAGRYNRPDVPGGPGMVDGSRGHALLEAP